MMHSVAPSRRARSILPCHPNQAVLQPCLQRTLALLWKLCEERVRPPSMGPQRTQRAWGLARASRPRHCWHIAPSVAQYWRARSMLPCRHTLAVLQPCLQRTPALLWYLHGERERLPSMGPQRTMRAWGLAPASRAWHRRCIGPSAAPYWRARPILSCRPTLAVLQPCLQRTSALLLHLREERV